MVWGAVAAIAGGAILQGVGNERSARAVRRNSRMQARYIKDYSDKKLDRSQAFANSLSHVGDDYMDQVTRYYNARNSSDRSDKGRAAYEAQEAKTIQQAGEILGDVGLVSSPEEKEMTKGLKSADISPYMEVMKLESQRGAEREFEEERGLSLFQAGEEIEAGARTMREDFQLKEAEEGLAHQGRMQDFALAGQKAERAGETLTAVGGVVQAGGMVSAMF